MDGLVLCGIGILGGRSNSVAVWKPVGRQSSLIRFFAHIQLLRWADGEGGDSLQMLPEWMAKTKLVDGLDWINKMNKSRMGNELFLRASRPLASPHFLPLKTFAPHYWNCWIGDLEFGYAQIRIWSVCLCVYVPLWGKETWGVLTAADKMWGLRTTLCECESMSSACEKIGFGALGYALGSSSRRKETFRRCQLLVSQIRNTTGFSSLFDQTGRGGIGKTARWQGSH